MRPTTFRRMIGVARGCPLLSDWNSASWLYSTLDTGSRVSAPAIRAACICSSRILTLHLVLKSCVSLVQVPRDRLFCARSRSLLLQNIERADSVHYYHSPTIGLVRAHGVLDCVQTAELRSHPDVPDWIRRGRYPLCAKDDHTDWRTPARSSRWDCTDQLCRRKLLADYVRCCTFQST